MKKYTMGLISAASGGDQYRPYHHDQRAGQTLPQSALFENEGTPDHRHERAELEKRRHVADETQAECSIAQHRRAAGYESRQQYLEAVQR